MKSACSALISRGPIAAALMVLWAPSGAALPLKLSWHLASVPTESSASVALPLRDAYGLALDRDLTYAAALAAFRVEREQVPQARAGLRPQVDLAGSMGASRNQPVSKVRSSDVNENHSSSVTDTQSTTQTSTHTVNRQPDVPSANTDVQSHSGTSTHSTSNEQLSEHLRTQSWQNTSARTQGVAANLEVSVRWPIYRPALDRHLELSQIIESQARVRLNAARQDVAIRVSKAYFDAILSQESLKAIGAEKSAIAAQLKVAERSFEGGETTIADVREAQAKWDIVLAQEIALRNAQEVRLSALRSLIGVSVGKVQGLRVDDLLTDPPHLGIMTEWIRKAEEQAYSVQIETLGLEAATKNTAKQGAAHKPSLDFVASLGAGRSLQRSKIASESASSVDASRNEPSQTATDSHTSSEANRNGDLASGTSSSSSQSDVQSSSTEATQTSSSSPSSKSRTSSTQYDGYIGLRLNIPLSDGGFTSSKVREAVAMQEQKAIELERARVSAALATQTAFLEAQGFFAEATALRSAEQSGMVALKSNEMGYRAGVRINSDILNTQQQLFAVRRNLVQSQVAALLATLRLKASAGLLTDAEMGRVDRWLK